MRRGETPEIIVTSKTYDFTACDDVWLTIKCNDHKMTIKRENLEISTTQIKATLTQEQTLSLPHGFVRLQIKALTGTHVDESDIKIFHVGDVLDDEVMG